MKILSKPMPDPPPGVKVGLVRLQLLVASIRAEKAFERADAVLDALARAERVRQSYANVKLRRRSDGR